MKLRYLLIPFLTLLAIVTGCSSEDPISSNDNALFAEPSVVAFESKGGTQTAEINSKSKWTIEYDKEKTAWLEVSPLTGEAGATVVSFTSTPNKGGSDQEVELKVVAGEKVQYLNVILKGAESSDLKITPIPEVLKAKDGEEFAVQGTVSNIINWDYGNFTLLGNKEGESIFIYGVLDADGNAKNFKSLNIEEGDKVILQGPKASYNGKPQMKAVSLIKIKKSLIKVEKSEYEVGHEAGTVEVKLTVKGSGINVEPVDSWITIRGISENGETKVVTFSYTENTELDKRKGTVKFTSGEDKAFVKIIQEGRPATEDDIVEVNIKDLLAAQVGGPRYKVSGVISEIVKEDYGNLMLTDGTGTIYVYGLTTTNLIGEKNDKSFKELGLKVGDYLTIIGSRGQYAGAKVESQKEQITGPAYIVSYIKAEEMSIADFLTQEINPEKRYRLTGTVKNIKMDKKEPTKINPFGNFDLVDGDASVFVFGLVDFPTYNIGGEKPGRFSNNKSFESLGIKEGDVITICSKFGQYKENKQAVESYFISKAEK